LGTRLAAAHGVRAIAPDLPGFGRTPPAPALARPGAPTPEEQADQLLAWMDARGLERPVIVAHSTGRQTAAALAARAPHRVERLVLAAPTHDPRRRTIARALPRFLAGALVEAPSILPVLGLEYAAAGHRRLVGQAARTLADAPERLLPRVEAPTLVLRGALDTIVGQRWAEAVARALPRGMLVVIERAGHAVQWSASAVTADAIARFLDGRLDPARPPLDRAVVSPADDPRRDPLGLPRPIGPGVHAMMDVGAAAAALTAAVLGRGLGWGRTARGALAGTALASLASNFATDHGTGPVRGLPMVTHAAADVGLGLGLLGAAAGLRREPPAGRWALAALGAAFVGAAALTAKPTGPARRRWARRPARRYLPSGTPGRHAEAGGVEPALGRGAR
jgi:pimeloyl-ACP methyl ester carboxylesterase